MSSKQLRERKSYIEDIDEYRLHKLWMSACYTLSLLDQVTCHSYLCVLERH